MARLRIGRSTPAVARQNAGGDSEGLDQAQRILVGLEDLRDTPVREIMTPRVDVVGLPIPVSAGELARAVRQSGHSTFPVYDDDLDNLVGVLYVRDLFRAGWEIDRTVGPQWDASTPNSAPAAPAADTADDPLGVTIPGTANGEPRAKRQAPSPLDISRRIRQPYVVPESRMVLDVLADMRHDRRAFAVVADEYGGMAGIVTIKDLLGALVGDLRDEFDRGGEPDFIRVDRERWLVDGGVSVDELRDRLAVPVPDGEYVTLGGYLFDVSGHIPEEGERIRVGRWEYRVVEMDRRRVAKVVVRALEPGDLEGG
ncbi:MAG: CBS domain-containing protein [Actinomycetota bacterium]|jgi:CBS domain containing-hemolysin-like protein|nr:CBS domain-containing protein [Actinomycetota bacterium]